MKPLLPIAVCLAVAMLMPVVARADDAATVASVTKWSVRISKPAAELEPKLDHAVKLADTGSAKLSKAADLIPGLIG